MKKQKGITLIALIITIIVMMILVGITVNVALNGGLFNSASKASKKMQLEADRETLQAAVAAAMMNNGFKIQSAQDLQDNLPNGWQVVKTGEVYICTSPKGNEFKVTEDGKIIILTSLQDISFDISEVQGTVISETENVVVIDAYGNSVKVPAGFKITNDANNVVDGIVIEDCTGKATEGSQFVWIPVGTIKIDSEGTTVDNPLERYSGEEDTKYGSGPITTGEEIYNYQCNVNTAETEEFELSVESNGGYYIGRYEARTADGQRGSEDKLVAATDTLTCKASDYLYNYVNYSDALRLSKEMYTGTVFSSNLVNSYAWDTALEYFETVTDAKTYSETPSINQGSEDGKVNFCWKGTVGTQNEDKICNVYDMASNSYEWSTEVHIEGKANIARGGVYSSPERKASAREICDITTEGYHTLTFRVVLYLDENNVVEEEIIEIPTLSGEKLLEGNYIKKLGDIKVVIPKGFGIVNTTGNEETILASIEEYDTYITETNISNGIVVKDAQGNEFVWIPVNDINSMVMCQNAKENEECTLKLKGDTLKCTKHNSEALAGKLYATETGNNFEADLTGQTYNATNKFSEPVGLSDSDTQEFNNMAISVAKNGGFYVGRYETGGFNETKVVSKQGRGTGARGDINSTTWDVMYRKQKAFGNNTVGSSMIWGCQYDQVMKFVDGKNGFDVKEADSTNRHSGSSTKGTGNTPADFVANIYDLEDNMSEWTMESYNGTKRVFRGGGYKTSNPASNRTGYGPTNSNSDLGSRMTLYIKAEEKIEPPEEGEILTEKYIKKVGETKVVIPEGFGIVDTTGTTEYILKEEKYEKYITETSISNGIVVKDAQGNEFVWIPVNDINSMVMCQSAEEIPEGAPEGTTGRCTLELQGETLKCTKHNSEALAGRLYADKTIAIEGENFNANLTGQTYNPTSGYREPANLTECGNKITLNDVGTTGVTAGKEYPYDSDEMFRIYGGVEKGYYYENMYQDDFNKMATSVAKNGGFYVGRYETGGFNETKVVSKADRGMNSAGGDINTTTWYKMYKMQKDFGNNTVGSSMIWGCQYDQVMKFINGKLDGNGKTFNVMVTDASRHSGSTITGTGNTPEDFVANIYDLEGGMLEFTLEGCDNCNRINRGGNYNISAPASFRWKGYISNIRFLYVTSRLTLYIK